MKVILKRYIGFIIVVTINIILFTVDREMGFRSMAISGSNFLEMIQVLPPVFILLGLMDVWVPREVMVKLMGEESGILGILIAFFMGSFAAGPLYAAFPIAVVLMKKGSKFSNIIIFLGAWSTTKVPMFLFETASMGWKFSVTRLIMSIIGIIIIGYLVELFVSKEEKNSLYSKVNLMQ